MASRIPLNRERVLRAAIELADERGFDALTMRGLAQRLDVQAMSLYNHIADKADLRDGIVDLVLTAVEVPVPGGDWRAELRRSAFSLYSEFRVHRWVSREMMHTRGVSPARARWMEGVLATLRHAGCSPSLAHHFYHALDAHTTGFALWQANFPFTDQADMEERGRAVMREIGTDYPYLLEHFHEHLSPDPQEPGEFEFGLDLILDGVAARL
jgi:AcrR family transcriptional regulator